MKANLISKSSQWELAHDSAMVTANIDRETGEPTEKWKKRILLAEHSPIRQLTFNVLMSEIKSWVSVHITRHKIGIEHFVSTRRTDRTGINRDELRQDELVNHQISLLHCWH